ncbi:hypothetical protein C9374_010601 [Naegleria lovaniensis]|uniref:Chromate transporter n=1 Tax=Naegleria lovaniensis TaxID=51637 RepID=A0AA88GBF5_NAELO|nr:uncharacterized protein C9374_010601 [Naegleria lovaniensis]KAG2374582.1 hypothetical protein C9374_010601 [Naegleria lovaniensis]
MHRPNIYDKQQEGFRDDVASSDPNDNHDNNTTNITSDEASIGFTFGRKCSSSNIITSSSSPQHVHFQNANTDENSSSNTITNHNQPVIVVPPLSSNNRFNPQLSNDEHHHEEEEIELKDLNDDFTPRQHYFRNNHSAPSESAFESESLVEEGEHEQLFKQLREEQQRKRELRKKITWCTMLKETFKIFLPLGCTTFVGGIAVVQKMFVDQKKWLTENEFMEIYALSQSLPGPIISQVVFSIAMLRFGFWSGFLSNILFCGPGFLGCLLFGWLMADVNIDENSPRWLANLQFGLATSGIAFAVSSAWRMAGMLTKMKSKVFPYVLAGSIAITTMIYRTTWLLPALIGLGAALSCIYLKIEAIIEKRIQDYHIKEQAVGAATFEDEEMTIKQKLKFVWILLQSFVKPKPSVSTEEVTVNDAEVEAEQEQVRDVMSKQVRTHSPLWLGFTMLAIFIMLFVVLLVCSAIFAKYKRPHSSPTGADIFKESILVLSFFYRMGTFIFGGGVGGIPLLMPEMLQRQWMTKEQFMNGFALSNALPGPKYNVAAYFGAAIGVKFSSFPTALNSTSNSTLIASNVTSVMTFDTDFYSVNGSTIPITPNTHRTALFFILPPLLGLLSGIFFHLPGYLTMTGFLPLWRKIRENNIIKMSLVGVNAVCIGYVISNAIDMWIDNVGMNQYLAACTMFCFLLNFFDFSPPIIVIAGAVVAIVGGEIGYAIFG